MINYIGLLIFGKLEAWGLRVTVAWSHTALGLRGLGVTGPWGHGALGSEGLGVKAPS